MSTTNEYEIRASELIAIFHPTVDVPLREAHDWMMTKDPDALKAAIRVLRHLRQEETYSIRVAQELVLALLEGEGLASAEKELKLVEKEFTAKDEETLSRFGRLYRDLGEGAQKRGDASEARRLYRVAWQHYDQAFAIRGGHYPGINRASLYVLESGVAEEGQRADLVAKGQTAARDLLARRTSWPRDLEDDAIWHAATAAEAHLLVGEYAEAHENYLWALEKGTKPFYKSTIGGGFQRLKPILVKLLNAPMAELDAIGALFA